LIFHFLAKAAALKKTLKERWVMRVLISHWISMDICSTMLVLTGNKQSYWSILLNPLEKTPIFEKAAVVNA